MTQRQRISESACLVMKEIMIGFRGWKIEAEEEEGGEEGEGGGGGEEGGVEGDLVDLLAPLYCYLSSCFLVSGTFFFSACHPQISHACIEALSCILILASLQLPTLKQNPPVTYLEITFVSDHFCIISTNFEMFPLCSM